jgi:thioredoxin 1
LEDEELRIINEKRMKKLQHLINEKELLKNIKEPLNLDDATFFQTINKFPLILVDFWAPWCGPCKMMSPIIEQIGKDYLGKLITGKLNVDENPLVARQFGISSIPTLILFKRGHAVDKIIGSVSKNRIDEMVKIHLS